MILKPLAALAALAGATLAQPLQVAFRIRRRRASQAGNFLIVARRQEDGGSLIDQMTWNNRRLD